MKYDNHPDPQGKTADPKPQNPSLLKESFKQDVTVLRQFETSLKRQLQKESQERWVHGVSLLDKIKSVVGVIFHSLGSLIFEGVNDCFETFSKHIAGVFQTTFLAEQHDDFGYVLVALHLVNQLSIQQFENHVWTKQIKSKQALVVTSLLLNDANLHLARSLCKNDGVQTDDWYSLKRQILLEQIEKKLRSDPGSDTVFYNNCLKNLGHDVILPFYPKKCESTDAMRCCIPKVKKVFLWDSINVQTEADGNTYERANYPPGQRSVYIPPGDSCQESYRLSTFLRFSEQIPVSPIQLASAGFLYTGYKDRVKCFSCGLCVEDWVLGDDVRSPRWHRSDCAHAHEGESGNVPIGAQEGTSANLRMSEQVVMLGMIQSQHHEHFLKSIDLRKESERIRTFEHFPTDAPTVTSHDLARSGFFYLGNLDRVQCFSCGGVLRNWNYGDSVQSEHRRHFPNCKMLENNEPRNVPLTSDERAAIPQQTPTFTEPPDPPEAEQLQLDLRFPCKYPVNAHMRNEDSRLQTFDKRWSANNVQATPQQISRAGFFYIGERDRVRCWYCNGGLQNWDPQDEPWTEHAKWFPTCEFLLQRKGPDFVRRMVSMFPNLPLPLLRGPFDVTAAQWGSNSARAPTPHPEIIDPQAELDHDALVDRAMASDIVKIAIEFGFSQRLVRKAVQRRIRHSSMYTSIEDLVGILVDEESNDNQELSDNQEEPVDHTTNAITIDGLFERQNPHGGATEEDTDDENELDDVMRSDVVQSVCQTLCENQRQKVKDVVKKRHREGGKYTTASELIKDVQETKSIQDRIRELQEERKCKICLDQLSDIVFVPCGHLCCCEYCATSLRKCPICRKSIEKAIKTYIP